MARLELIEIILLDAANGRVSHISDLAATQELQLSVYKNAIDYQKLLPQLQLLPSVMRHCELHDEETGRHSGVYPKEGTGTRPPRFRPGDAKAFSPPLFDTK
jgi:hypothetical protein